MSFAASSDVRPRPPVTALVCTRGRAALLLAALRTVMDDLGPADELLVVEAESRHAEALIAAAADPRCRWLAAPRPGKSAQLNHGLSAARHRIVAITDDDCAVPRGWLAGMAEPFAEQDVAVVFGPVEGLSSVGSGRAGEAPGQPGPGLTPGPAPPHMWAFSHGASMAVDRDAARAAGGFDERLGPGAPAHGEEADLLLRLQALGWRGWAADAPAVRHADWREPAEHARNLLVYERGGGAWVGAALRRGDRSALGAVLTRLRYQRGLLSADAPAAFRARAQLAFAGGVRAGLAMGSAHFLTAADGPAGDDPLGRLPYPALRGRRCLCVGPRAARIAPLLAARGARVETRELSALGGALGGPFQVVVAGDVLTRADAPQACLRALAAACEDALLSIESVDVALSLAGRRRPLVARPSAAVRRINGAEHRRALEAAGLSVAFASAPWRDSAPGLSRALLCHPVRR